MILARSKSFNLINSLDDTFTGRTFNIQNENEDEDDDDDERTSLILQQLAKLIDEIDQLKEEDKAILDENSVKQLMMELKEKTAREEQKKRLDKLKHLERKQEREKQNTIHPGVSFRFHKNG